MRGGATGRAVRRCSPEGPYGARLPIKQLVNDNRPRLTFERGGTSATKLRTGSTSWSYACSTEAEARARVDRLDGWLRLHFPSHHGARYTPAIERCRHHHYGSPGGRSGTNRSGGIIHTACSLRLQSPHARATHGLRGRERRHGWTPLTGMGESVS